MNHHVVVGSGGIGRAHAATLLRLKEKVSFCKLSDETTRYALRDFPQAGVLESFEAVLESDAVNSVVICLPHHLHEEFSTRAIKANKNVLLEKPLAHTLESARRIQKVYEQERPSAADPSVFMVAEQMNYLPVISSIRETVKDLSRCSYRFVERTPFTPCGWRNDLLCAGGGVLLDLGIHYVSLARQLFGEISASERRVLRSNSEGVPVEEEVSMLHVDGSSGLVAVAWETEPDSSLVIEGPRGKMRYRLDARFLWWNGRPHLVGLRFLNGRVQMIRRYLRAIEERSVLPDLETGLKLLQVVLA